MKTTLIALAAALTLAAPLAQAQGSSGKLKIGLMLPSSGTYAALGTAIENGFKLYVAGDGVSTGVRHDQQCAAVFGHLGHPHRHAAVHGADQHVDLVALDQFVDVVGRLRGVGWSSA